jgi:hypothetical protein
MSNRWNLTKLLLVLPVFLNTLCQTGLCITTLHPSPNNLFPQHLLSSCLCKIMLSFVLCPPSALHVQHCNFSFRNIITQSHRWVWLYVKLYAQRPSVLTKVLLWLSSVCPRKCLSNDPYCATLAASHVLSGSLFTTYSRIRLFRVEYVGGNKESKYLSSNI